VVGVDRLGAEARLIAVISIAFAIPYIRSMVKR
jgi:hypothetical protein